MRRAQPGAAGSRTRPSRRSHTGVIDNIENIEKAGTTTTREAGRFSQAELSQRTLRSLQGNVARTEQELGGLVDDLAEGRDTKHSWLDALLTEVR